MPHILRSDTAKGYGSAARTPRIQKTIVPRASFLGVPPEVRVYIHNLLFSKVELDLWYYLRPDFKVRPGRFTTAILRICRQVYAEAKPVLFENLELDFDYTYWMEMVPQIHEKIQNLVLPHLQKLRFPYSTFNDTELPVDLFRQLSPCLKVVHIGFVSTKFDFSRSQMYNAAVNNVQEWPMILGQAITPVSSFDHYLMNVALRKCGVLSQDNIDDSELITSLWLRDLLADESRKFTVTGSVHGCMRNKHGASLTVVS